MLLLRQGKVTAAADAEVQAELGLLSATVFLFWSLVGCGGLAFWRRTRPLAAALALGALAGFVLAAVVADVA